MRLTKVILSALFAVAIGAAATPSHAASSIRVKVDDQPITTYDIQQRALLFKVTGAPGGEKAATDELIDETIQFIEAAKMGVSVSDARVNGAIEEIAVRVKMTPKGLTSALAEQGLNIDTLKRRIKAQMVWGQLVQMRMRMKGGSAKGSDVTAAMFSDSGKPGEIKTTEYTLKPVIFVVPKGSSGGYDAQRRREAEAFRGRFQGCDTLVEQTRQLKEVVVRPTMRRTSEELQGSPDGRDIQDAGAGKLTRPQRSDDGYVMLAVCTAKEIQSNAAARVEAENKLLDEINKDLGKEYMDELRKKAVIEYR
ncbi:MAG: SurA N-terminal domain-containing protein [Rhizobiales bacterium]|nr:SurA N-terminal domain-containing protein [Hyphomicrobiales bacterium]